VDPPIGELVHWVNAESASVVEELTITIEEGIEFLRLVAQHACLEDKIMTTGHHGHGVDLQPSQLADRLRCAVLPFTPTARPQNLKAQDAAARR
jgi:hypothetical protein